FAIFDEQGRKNRPGFVGGKVGHQALGRGVGPVFERVHDRPERGVAELVRLAQEAQKRAASLGGVEQERDQIALDRRHRGRRAGSRSVRDRLTIVRRKAAGWRRAGRSGTLARKAPAAAPGAERSSAQGGRRGAGSRSSSAGAAACWSAASASRSSPSSTQ